MMLFLIGDFETNTGPGIANNNLKGNIPGKVFYTTNNNKIKRTVEIIRTIPKSDCVLLCGYSKANIIAIVFSKIFNKKVFYLMHGYIKHENAINNQICRIDNLIESFIFKRVNKIFCVSKKHMEYIKKIKPKLSKKIDYCYNGIDFKTILNETRNINNSKKECITIMSTGGDMPRKLNKNICKAIDLLRNNGLNIKYKIAGKTINKDFIEIKEYDFVDYLGNITYARTLEEMCNSDIYIQNSIFETFGLAVIEAVFCGCNLLVSKNVGAIEVIKSIEDKDIIEDVYDINEIAEKIKYLTRNNNNERLIGGIDQEENSCENRYGQLYKKIYSEWEKK